MDGRDFHLNTDYPFDKVILTLSGSFNAGPRYDAYSPRRTTLPIDHNLGSYGLITGVFSTDGTNWLPFGVVNADTSGALPTFQTVEVTAYCTDTQVVLMASNYLTSTQNVRYALQVLSRD